MASALKTAEIEIESRLNSNWTTTSIAWPGVDFTPPDAAWVRPTVNMGAGTMWTMGTSGTNIVSGVLELDIFAKPGSGYGVIRGYADTLRDLFDRVHTSNVRFGAASGPRKIPDDAWLMLKIEVPFTVEETT